MRDDDALQQLLQKFKAAFPEAVTETQHTDDDGKPYYTYALKEEFLTRLQDAGLDIADDQNRYELRFPGKRMAAAQMNLPTYKTLVADKAQSKNFEDTANLFIEGDNLDVLRLLQNGYRDKVKMIYIDPPYNTGGDDFVYNDDFSVKQKEYMKAAGMLNEDDERQISAVQDGLRGRFHSRWLAMMLPRLKLARELLTDDGVIFISIDDNEQANLKLICDEVFGEENFVNTVTIINNLKGNNSDKFFSGIHEYGLVYTKNKNENITFNKFTNDDDWKNWQFDDSGAWKQGGILSATQGKTDENTNNNFPVYISENDEVNLVRKSDTDIELLPKSKGKVTRWYWSKETFQKRREDILVIKSKEKNISLYGKQRLGLAEIPQSIPKSVMYKKGYGQGSSYIEKLMGAMKLFSNPKAINLIIDILYLFTNKGDIILDFFAGSGTTGDAVMQLNAEDGGNRKFIMVQLPEEINARTSEAAHAFCRDELKRPATIAEIAKERIRRAGKQINEQQNGEKTDTGFRAFTVRDSLLTDNSQQPLAETSQRELLKYRTELKRENFEPLLYEALLKSGVPLDLPLAVHEAANYPFAVYDRRCYCVTENLTQAVVREIAERHGDSFDILYYLTDCPAAKTSFTELEAALRLTPGNKIIQPLHFY